MKVRNGFVSNSSSSSFIVSFDPSKFIRCSSCGHRRPDPLEIVKHSYDEESCISHDNADSILGYYSSELKDLVIQQERLGKRNPNEPLSPTYAQWTVRKQLECSEEDTKYINKNVEAIQQAVDDGLQVVHITLSDHTNQIEHLKELVEEGVATLISGDIET